MRRTALAAAVAALLLLAPTAEARNLRKGETRAESAKLARADVQAGIATSYRIGKCHRVTPRLGRCWVIETGVGDFPEWRWLTRVVATRSGKVRACFYDLGNCPEFPGPYR